MTIELNHTIVYSRDKHKSAHFLAELLGMSAPKPFGPFQALRLDNGVTLDYFEADRPVAPAHYAFLISESAFDEVLARLKERGLPYWADPVHTRPDAFNTADGGRGLYFEDPSGHNMEVLTRPYGSGTS